MFVDPLNTVIPESDNVKVVKGFAEDVTSWIKPRGGKIIFLSDVRPDKSNLSHKEWLQVVVDNYYLNLKLARMFSEIAPTVASIKWRDVGRIEVQIPYGAEFAYEAWSGSNSTETRMEFWVSRDMEMVNYNSPYYLEKISRWNHFRYRNNGEAERRLFAEHIRHGNYLMLVPTRLINTFKLGLFTLSNMNNPKWGFLDIMDNNCIFNLPNIHYANAFRQDLPYILSGDKMWGETGGDHMYSPDEVVHRHKVKYPDYSIYAFNPLEFAAYARIRLNGWTAHTIASIFPADIKSMESFMWTYYVVTSDPLPLHDVWLYNQTYSVRRLGSLIRTALSIPRDVYHLPRKLVIEVLEGQIVAKGWAQKSSVRVVTDPDYSGELVTPDGQTHKISVAGHALNMLLNPSNDFNRFIGTVEANSKYVLPQEDSVYLSEKGLQDVWHTVAEHWLTAATYLYYCKMLGLKVRVRAYSEYLRLISRLNTLSKDNSGIVMERVAVPSLTEEGTSSGGT
jgi:hypothetical protein